MQNQDTANKLRKMNLSKKAKEIIESTEINVMYELFGKFETAEEVEEFIKEYYENNE